MRSAEGRSPTPSDSGCGCASNCAGGWGPRSAASARPRPRAGGSDAIAAAAFYCVADERYFLGAVGLVNSLRLQGHSEPIYLLDCGLSERQRELIGPEVELLAGPRDPAPQVLKAIAPLTHPAEVMVLIDTDMIATRPLGELIEAAAGGRVVAGSAELDRHCPEWSELLGLGRLRRLPYVSTGLVACGGELGREVLRLTDERRDVVDFELSFWRRNVAEYPLVHADQDLINAALAACAREDELVVLDPRLSASPPFTDLRVVDERRLRCAYGDGLEPLVVHHWLAKPWLEPTHHGVYSRLLRRLLIGDDVAVTVPEAMIPLRFRGGPLAYMERKRINARERWRWHVREPLAARREAARG